MVSDSLFRHRKAVAKLPAKSLIMLAGAPYRNRTGVFAVRGRRPGPLDEGSLSGASGNSPDPATAQARPTRRTGGEPRRIGLPFRPRSAARAGGSTHAQTIVQLA